ncbi:unnamed protein product, partial [Meganyctiphanes norvegica]
APIVWIIENVTQPSLAPEYMRSRLVRIESDAIVNCNGSVATSKEWSLMQVSELDGNPIKEIITKEVINSWNFSMLSIPERFLEYGTYLVSYRLQLLASKIFPLFRISSTYIKIVPTPLLASLIEGGLSKVSRGYQDSILLEPYTFSEDPDFPEEKVFNYTWFCRRVDMDDDFIVVDSGDPLDIRIQSDNIQDIPKPFTVTQELGGGCFGKGPGAMNYNKGKLNLQIASLTHYDALYEIVVMIQKDKRYALTKVQIKVLKEAPPEMSIQCADPKLCIPTFGGVYVNPSSRIALASICSDYCDPGMTYRWQINSADGQNVKESRTCGGNSSLAEPTPSPTPPPEDKGASLGPDPCPPLIPTGKESMDIAIGSDFFKENDKHESFKITLFVRLPSGVEGEYVMTLKLNKPPFGGSCKIEPSEGLAMIDDFIVSCQDWQDPEEAGIDQYSYFVYEPTDSGPQKRTIIAATQPKAELLMPVGNFTLYCDIWDKYGTFVEVEVGELTAFMPNQTLVEAYNVGDVLEYLSATGNQFKIGMLLTAQ